MAGPGSAPWNIRRGSHVGFIGGNSPGRADTRPMRVPNGSFVFPADSLAGLGQGNAMAGARVLDAMFSGPYGTKPMRVRGGRPHYPRMPSRRMPQFQDGGEAEGSEDIPIRASDAEYIVPPEAVRMVGNSNLDHGHEVLRKLVLLIREKQIEVLENLDPPK